MTSLFKRMIYTKHHLGNSQNGHPLVPPCFPRTPKKGNWRGVLRKREVVAGSQSGGDWWGLLPKSLIVEQKLPAAFFGIPTYGWFSPTFISIIPTLAFSPSFYIYIYFFNKKNKIYKKLSAGIKK